MAVGGHAFQDLVAVIERGGHQVGGFVGGVTEHDPLVARAFILVVAGIDALRDVRGLAVQAVDEFELLPVEAVLRIADLAHGLAHRRFDLFLRAGRPFAVLEHALAADLTSENHQLGGGQRFAGDPGFGVLGQEQVNDGVGNLIRNLVGMAFGDRFGGKEIVAAHFGSDIKKALCDTCSSSAEGVAQQGKGQEEVSPSQAKADCPAGQTASAPRRAGSARPGAELPEAGSSRGLRPAHQSPR